jgi:phosphatidylserine decarboxylase
MRFRIDPAGLPFVLGALALGIVAGLALGGGAATPLLALAVLFLFFFRDPERLTTAAGDQVVAPADGRVLVAGPARADAAPPEGEWRQVSIFLSPMDVHVNRIPVSGTVTQVTFTRGRFLPAYRSEAAAINERSEIRIDHRGQTIVVRQIVGVLARRVVCRVETGAAVQAGDRYGVMKFGSRMDVFFPPTADILVNVNDTVRGGETVIAVLH